MRPPRFPEVRRALRVDVSAVLLFTERVDHGV
jgi:hypothetical protein